MLKCDAGHSFFSNPSLKQLLNLHPDDAGLNSFYIINRPQQQQRRILTVCFTLQCSQRMEGVESVVPQLWKGCSGAERDMQSCPNLSTFTRPRVYPPVGPCSTHAQDTCWMWAQCLKNTHVLTCTRRTFSPDLAATQPTAVTFALLAINPTKSASVQLRRIKMKVIE